LKATVFEFIPAVIQPSERRVLFSYRTYFETGKAMLFTETLVLPKSMDLKSIPADFLEKLLQGLSLVIGVSYYKFYCATEFKMAYRLSDREAEFWNIVYKKGLGEFWFQNHLDPDMLPKFPVSTETKSVFWDLKRNQKSLVGIGGGKDSIVAMELLKEHGFEATAFHVETGKPSRIIENVIKQMGAKQLKIQRFLDPKAYEKHQYNGHIPISAIYAFLGVFAAITSGHSYVIVGNEYSSNFGNANYKGLEINHQWSKSFEFEKLFQDYTKNFLSPDVMYFSLLRPFYEIRIVKLFSKYKKYFKLFSSCNRNFTAKGNEKGVLWCGVCAKCIFAFTLLSAFLPKKELVAMFGKNLYQDENLLPMFKDILGLGTMKPFDCVGTFEESQTALHLAKKRFARDFIVRQLGDNVQNHPEVFQTHKENSVPEQFKFLGMESVYILGFGKEGKITKQYLRKTYPKMKIGVGDEAIDKQYLEKQRNFDIAIKTPGINKSFVTIPHTTATNIFFSKVSGKNMIIGVTGSKGKSTTSSLIYHILKVSGKDVELLGNIGKPMLQAVLKPSKRGRIYVLELSSYQLDDIGFSPDIAVVTNLFPEHLDYHKTLEAYYGAKKNIINFYGPEGYFVHNHKTADWLPSYRGKALAFSEKDYESNLVGQHNKSNINAAVRVAEILKIPESKIKQAIKTFKGLPHRLEFIGEFKGIKFYDDAISTTPDSTIMALEALPDVDTIFLGGTDRGYDFTQLEKELKRHTIKNVVLFPDSGNRINISESDFSILRTDSMKKAIEFAYKHTRPGKIALLSCASPSYSLWKNFEVKGDLFQQLVKKLGKK
jgi:UDP-N-acetylmuramoylalanine-D-glutamate ligase